MSDNIERELDYILEQDVARDSRIEGFQQELLELRAQVLRLTQQNQQKVLSSVSQCNLMLTKLQKLPKIVASMLREGESVSPEIVEKELDKLLESQCRAMRTALDPLSEFANRVTEAASEAHAKHDEELDEIFAQTLHDDYCMRELSKKLGVKSTEKVKTVPSTSAQADAEQTPMETEQIETQQSDFRKAFELLKANDLSTDVALQPIEFDAVTAAEGEPLSRQAHSYGSYCPRQFVDRTPFQMNVSVTEPLRPMEQPSPVRGNPSKALRLYGVSPPAHQAYEKLENLAQGIERNKKVAAATRSASELKQVNEQRKPRRSFPFQKVEESADRARNVQNRSQDSGEQSSQSPIQHDSLPPQADRGFCRICKKPGHLLRDCDKRQQGAGQQNSEHALSPNNVCPKQPKRTFTTVLGNWSCLTSGLHHSKNELSAAKLCWQTNVQLLGFTRRALVDTGSRVSILPLSILLDAKRGWVRSGRRRRRGEDGRSHKNLRCFGTKNGIQRCS
ncbi:zinc knuckle [Ostertagia ostertagi]